MKLKKIASLALAGIMAVSMLAGCKDGGNSNSGSSSENTNTNTGYSAMLGQKAADTLAKNDLDDVFTFADNSGYVDDLEKAVRDEITPKNILDFVTNYTVQRLDKNVGSVRAGLRDAFDTNAKLTRMYYEHGWYTSDNVNTQTIGDVWVANGNISMDNVLDTIFNTYKNDIADADKTGKATVGGTTVELNYDYDVAVSVVNVPLSNYTQINGSVNFIAVTFTRNADIA